MSEIDSEGQYNPEEILDEQTTLWLAPQFVEHVRFVLGKLPQSDGKKLRDRNPMIFAPDPILGRAMEVRRSMEAGDGYILYLSPALVQRKTDDSTSTEFSDKEIRFTIAHEIAHVVLGHQELPSADAHAQADDGEREADELAQSWGFVRPERFNRF